jgi:hypothetical protein
MNSGGRKLLSLLSRIRYLVIAGMFEDFPIFEYVKLMNVCGMPFLWNYLEIRSPYGRRMLK